MKGGGAPLDDAGDGLHSGQHLNSALRLAGLAGLGPKAVDEALHMLSFGQLTLALRRLMGQIFVACADEAIVVALITDELAALQMNDAVHDPIEQISICYSIPILSD